MTERVEIGHRLSVSRVNDPAGQSALILWQHLSGEHVPLGTIGQRSGHAVDTEALTVTPSIVVGHLHGFLTNGEWREA